MTKAIAKIIRDGKCPKNLHDRGKEFHNLDMQKFLTKHNINHYFTYSLMKVVEWFNRMLKNDMQKQFTHNGNYKWIDILQRLVSNTRKQNYWYTSRQCYSRDRRQALNYGLQSRKDCSTRAIQMGDLVRVSKFKIVFDKGYTPNSNTEVFKIIKVQ